jgi:membrane protease YdiL (CAAX protease family)
MFFYPDIDVKDYKTLIKLDVVSSLFVSIVLVILYSKLIISDKNKIKQQGKRGIKKFFEMCLVGFVSFMGVKILASIVETTMFGIFGLEYQTSENQSLIEQMTGSAPLLMAISACIFAPITEELLFRGAIKNIIKNKKVFITVSGLIFGLIHVTDSILLIFEIAVIGVLLDTIIHKESIDKSDKILLSVTMTVILLIIFGGIFYFQYGNLIFKLQSLDMAEVIGSITYIIMGVYLAYLYAYQLHMMSDRLADNIQ